MLKMALTDLEIAVTDFAVTDFEENNFHSIDANTLELSD